MFREDPLNEGCPVRISLNTEAVEAQAYFLGEKAIRLIANG
jgi:hypothetical protein